MSSQVLTGKADLQRLPGFLETTADPAFVASISEARLSRVNTAFCTIVGFPPSDLVGKVFFDFLHPHDRQSAIALISADSGQPWELAARFRRKNGEYLWIEWHGKAHTGSWVVTGRDISRHILLEQALHDSEARLALALESARLGTFDYDPQAGKLVCSRIAFELAGLPPGTAERYRAIPDPPPGLTGDATSLSQHWEFEKADYEQLASLLSLEDLNAGAEILLDLQAGLAVNRVHKVKGLDGVTRHLRVRASPEFDQSGVIQRICGTMQDVTEPEAAKQRLHEERNQFEAYLESAPEGVVSIDADGRMLLVNSRIEAMFGYSRGELLGQSVDMLLPERFAEAHARHRAGFFGAASRRPMGQGLVFPGRRRDGVEFPVEVGLNWVRREDQMVAVAVVTDVTLRHAREAERQQVLDTLRDLGRRLEEARELERKRIAHEIHDGLGQELVALKMRMALLGSVLAAESHSAARQVSQMTDQVESMVRTIQRVATNLRPDVLDRLGLAPAVEWLVSEFERNEGIPCARSIEEISVDPQSATIIFRVVQEFLTNVLRHAGATQIWLRLAEKDGDIEVEIRDDGHGIHPGDLHKPDTTGLASARERVLSTGGKMEILGQPGEGTMIRLRLPRAGGFS